MPVRESLGTNPHFAAKSRTNIFRVLIIVTTIIFIGQLAYLQIIKGSAFRSESEAQAIKRIIVEPFRGNMYDIDSNLIVHNEPSFSVTLTPNDFKIESLPLLLSIIPVDTLDIINDISVLYSKKDFNDKIIPMLDTLLNLDSSRIKKKSTNIGYYSRFTPLKIYRDANYSEVSLLEEYNDYLSGIDVIVESKRLYQHEGKMGHILGYSKEISPEQLEILKYYRPGDLIGKRGLEKSYEKILRGQKGVQFVAVNSAGKKISSFDQGKNDIISSNGFDLYLTIKQNLQKKAEDLLEGQRGGIVAINPNNGEVYAIASAPDFDPKEFSGKISPEYYQELIDNPGNPMYNRCVQARNSPGSTWKMLVAAAALQAGVIDENTTFYCNGGLKYGRFFKCHSAHGKVNVRKAIQVSCNTFFYHCGLKLGMKGFEKYGKMFGFGRLTGIDLPGESKGLLPTMKWLKENPRSGGFQKGKLLNYGIGQGEILVTPIQMAAYTASLANGGTYYQPHIVRAIRNNVTNKIEPVDYQSRIIPIKKKYFDIIRKGMYDVVNRTGGTASQARLSGIKVSGKTGTAQNPHGRDNAWFVCFAPTDKPEIAIVVFVENAGYGGAVAAPMARKLLQEFFYPGVDFAAKTSMDSTSASYPDTLNSPSLFDQ